MLFTCCITSLIKNKNELYKSHGNLVMLQWKEMASSLTSLYRLKFIYRYMY